MDHQIRPGWDGWVRSGSSENRVLRARRMATKCVEYDVWTKKFCRSWLLRQHARRSRYSLSSHLRRNPWEHWEIHPLLEQLMEQNWAHQDDIPSQQPLATLTELVEDLAHAFREPLDQQTRHHGLSVMDSLSLLRIPLQRPIRENESGIGSCCSREERKTSRNRNNPSVPSKASNSMCFTTDLQHLTSDPIVEPPPIIYLSLSASFWCPLIPLAWHCICLKYASNSAGSPLHDGTSSLYPVVIPGGIFQEPPGLAPLPYNSQHTKDRSPANGEWYGLRTAATIFLGLLALDPTASDACQSAMYCLMIKWFKWHRNDFWNCILAQLFKCHLRIVGVFWIFWCFFQFVLGMFM